MPKPREVKPWTIYPPTQVDREIIEKKAAEASLSVSAYLCMVGKLACIQVKTEQQVLSEPQQESKQPELTYTYYDPLGNPLTPKLAEFVRAEFVAGRVQAMDKYEQGSYGEPTAVSKRCGKLYKFTETGIDSETPFGFMFRVKEA